MITLAYNITKLTNNSSENIFHKIWATSIFTHVSTVYLFCLSIICLCLYCNRRSNLIYKVLNLAVLSVVVVALWSYLTDMTFIYIVYILTFVSAVVMLFLSVVLMLPSSAIAVHKKMNCFWLTLSILNDMAFGSFYYLLCLMLLVMLWIFVMSILFYLRYTWVCEAGKLVRASLMIRCIRASIQGTIVYRVKYFLLWLFSQRNVELLLQACTGISIFLLAIPYGNFNTRKIDFSVYLNNYASNMSALENLSNIQYELYVKSPLLMLVCVTGLLVALLGAALLVSTKILNSK